MKTNIQHLLVTTLLGIAIAGSQNASAQTVTVTSTADSGPGTLRDALANGYGDTINFSVTGMITLTSGELLLSRNVTIAGPGPQSLAISGNAASRVFHIPPGHSVTIAGVAIRNGASPEGSGDPNGLGGGIYNDHSTLTLSNCDLSGNSAAVFGGAIYTDGYPGGARLTLTNCTLCGNSALSGGAIATTFNSTLEVSQCTLNTNVATASDGGGAIYNNGSAQIISSIFSGNQGGGEGGAIYNQDGSLIVSNSTLIANSAWGDGGAVFNFGDSGLTSTVEILNSTLCGNTSLAGGAILNTTCCRGIANVQIINSTLMANSASEGGGVYNAGSDYGTASLLLLNSTLSGNSATNAGGGIWNEDGYQYSGVSGVMVLNSTLSGNSAGYGAAIVNYAYASNATVQIGSTILNNSGGWETIVSWSGFTSLGYNLSLDGGGGFLNQPTDQIYTDPELGPLQNNGGPTWTHALLPCSPAIDQGKNFAGAAGDQRGAGHPRTFDYPGVLSAPGGDHTDIGAFEVQSVINDTEPPALSVPRTITVNATSPAGATVNFSVVATDNIDRHPMVATSPASGATFHIGTTYVTCTGTDSCGNSARSVFQVVVLGASQQTTALIELVGSLHFAPGVKNSLDVKLRLAQADMTTANFRDFNPAGRQLTAFINEVRAQAGKKITNAQADQLISAAGQIETVLGRP